MDASFPVFRLTLLVAFSSALSAVAGGFEFATPPALRPSGGGVEWSASVNCADPAPSAWIGARVVFRYDFDLDGVAEARDTLGIAAADCGEETPARIVLRRRLVAAPPAELRAVLQTPAGQNGASHSLLTAGSGSLIAISRFCARPKNGEPEWIEVRNPTAFTLPLARVRLEARPLPGSLAPGESFVAGSDTAELALWQPGARRVGLSSWASLRNAGDTLRLALAPTDSLSPGLVLDSVVYGAGAVARENCASLETEGSAAAAAGYGFETGARSWRMRDGDWTARVRAPPEGRYDLRLYDTDGFPVCDLARNATGPAEYRLPSAGCARLEGRAGTFVLLLAPRAAPRVRTVIRIRQ